VSPPPTNPKLYHITHVQNLPSILAAGCLSSDAQRIARGLVTTNVGMTKIKERRLVLEVECHPGTKVGEYVPFYFCPRSIMLYLLYRGNHPELAYTDGQRLIVHLEADLYTVVRWAEAHNRRWAFSTSNAGAYYTRFFHRLDQLNEINWTAVAAWDFRTMIIREGKQAEFLLFDNCPCQLIERIGVINVQIAQQVTAILEQSGHKTGVSVQPTWYY
jgi:ssDNA thymidine ADP-ribosyltransferase, DarT